MGQSFVGASVFLLHSDIVAQFNAHGRAGQRKKKGKVLEKEVDFDFSQMFWHVIFTPQKNKHLSNYLIKSE